ncbi:MAG: heavy metal translocating P-type ATPase [Erysipelotrichaceae bacterium]
MEKTYKIKGMTCVICKANVEKALNNSPYISSVRVNLIENEATVNFDETKISEVEIARIIKDAGYELVTDSRNINADLIKLAVSIILMLILMYFSMIVMGYGYIQLVLSLIIMLINYPIYRNGIKALIRLNPNMDSLVSISSLVSFIYSLWHFKMGHLYFETAAMIPVLVSLGKYIEGKSKSKAMSAIRGLSTLIPMEANLLKDDEVTVVPINEIRKNDIVLVKPGESIPQDGIIIEGNSDVDESLITGESMPKSVTVNDSVIGGSINLNGLLKVKVTSLQSNSTIAKIINLTKKTASEKLPSERIADTISRYFVFGVMSISLITFIVWFICSRNFELSLNFALSVLVISCPCALGLATPSAIAAGLNVAAKNGILIKKGEVLETFSKTRTIIFDKTGTLTKNALNVYSYKVYDDNALNILTSIEASLNHPIAKAIVNYFPKGNLTVNELEFIPSKGIKAKIDDKYYLVGNKDLVSTEDSDYDGSIIYLECENKILATVYLSDELRPSAAKAVNKLKEKDVDVILCTGDNKKAADKMAKKLNIDEYLYSVKPEDKNALILKKKDKGLTAMVGDGINDSIALSSADVSLSLASASDIATSSSDVILTNDDLSLIPFLIDISKKTMRIIKQNLFWALFYNAIFIPVAAGVLYPAFAIKLNPMIGSFTMALSSIIVVFNALRIGKINKE